MGEWKCYTEDGLHCIQMPDGSVVRFLTLDSAGIKRLFGHILSLEDKIERLENK